MRNHSQQSRRSTRTCLLVLLALGCHDRWSTNAFMVNSPSGNKGQTTPLSYRQPAFSSTTTTSLYGHSDENNNNKSISPITRFTRACSVGIISASLLLAGANAVHAENELVAKYGGSGIDTSLIDQSCLLQQCGAQSQTCFADDPECRKGLTCTVKCLGDNSCITGCMARYGNSHLDNWLKCTMEDHQCLDLGVVAPGNDVRGSEAPAPTQTVAAFHPSSLTGSWYKVLGFNPNYDCYACQRNTFGMPGDSSTNAGVKDPQALQMRVEFSMPHLVPDGSAMAMNEYKTNEVMVFDAANSKDSPYGRTAHSEGEMFGLKFWENWYIIGENDKTADEEFKFVYYNGKTRQNTYEGAFVYSRTKELSKDSLARIYQIAQDAGMDPQQFCQIQNQCFLEDRSSEQQQQQSSMYEQQQQQQEGAPSGFWRGLLASTRVSELLGVEPVAARDTILRTTMIPTTAPAMTTPSTTTARSWWSEAGDYLENPHRHFRAMDDMRVTMQWPEDVVEQASALRSNRR